MLIAETLISPLYVTTNYVRVLKIDSIIEWLLRKNRKTANINLNSVCTEENNVIIRFLSTSLPCIGIILNSDDMSKLIVVLFLLWLVVVTPLDLYSKRKGGITTNFFILVLKKKLFHKVRRESIIFFNTRS